MAVKEIGIPSGFSADIEALELANIAGVKRVEQGDRKVIIYLDEVSSLLLIHSPTHTRGHQSICLLNCENRVILS